MTKKAEKLLDQRPREATGSEVGSKDQGLKLQEAQRFSLYHHNQDQERWKTSRVFRDLLRQASKFQGS